MSNHIDVESVAEVKIHAVELSSMVRNSRVSTSITFKLRNTRIKDDTINTLIEVFKQELGETGWNFFVYGDGLDVVVVDITKI